MRSKISFKVDRLAQFKNNALHWADEFPNFAYYENNNISYRYGSFTNILAVDIDDETDLSRLDRPPKRTCFELLNEFIANNSYWLFGYFTYDLKNENPACQPGKEPLFSNNIDKVLFPPLHFFKPKHVIFFNQNEVTVESSIDAQDVYEKISDYACLPALKFQQAGAIRNFFKLQQRVRKKEYIETVKKIKNHIIEGDIYELNYCIEFFAENTIIDPIHIFLSLNKYSPMPFAGIYKHDNKYLLCASPERFLKKIHVSMLISQPIKGTIERGKSPEEDKCLKQKLRSDEKELAENMMIVDLVRNDLARSSKTGSVQVDELFGIYKFKNLFQMISTVTSELKDNCHFIDAIKNAFPMGSMTGAPKIRAMELIEQYEKTKRGLFSGSLGYITPGRDFDFNVVIRSILYNQTTNYLSFQAGSAITYDSIPEKEYDECLLKAEAIMNTLSGN